MSPPRRRLLANAVYGTAVCFYATAYAVVAYTTGQLLVAMTAPREVHDMALAFCIVDSVAAVACAVARVYVHAWSDNAMTRSVGRCCGVTAVALFAALVITSRDAAQPLRLAVAFALLVNLYICGRILAHTITHRFYIIDNLAGAPVIVITAEATA